MADYKLVNARDLSAFLDALLRHGYEPGEFELQEDVYDPAMAEVEAALGEVGVRCLTTQAVLAYSVGPGRNWLQDFENDLRNGKMEGRGGTKS